MTLLEITNFKYQTLNFEQTDSTEPDLHPYESVIILHAQYSVLSKQYPVPSTHYLILNTQYSILSTLYSSPCLNNLVKIVRIQ